MSEGVNMSKEELMAQGREQTINMFKSCHGALNVGLFFGEHASAVGSCLKFLEALITQNEKKLAEEKGEAEAEKVKPEVVSE